MMNVSCNMQWLSFNCRSVIASNGTGR